MSHYDPLSPLLPRVSASPSSTEDFSQISETSCWLTPRRQDEHFLQVSSPGVASKPASPVSPPNSEGSTERIFPYQNQPFDNFSSSWPNLGEWPSNFQDQTLDDCQSFRQASPVLSGATTPKKRSKRPSLPSILSNSRKFFTGPSEPINPPGRTKGDRRNSGPPSKTRDTTLKSPCVVSVHRDNVYYKPSYNSGFTNRSPLGDQPPPLPPARTYRMSLTSLIAFVEKELQSLTAKTKDCDGLWQQLKEFQSHFVIKLTEIQQLKALMNQQTQVHNGQMPNQQKLEQIKSLLDTSNRQAGQLYQTLVDTRKAILVTLNDCADFVGRVRNELVNKVLLEWKRGQKLAQIGFPFDRQDELLDKIAHLFEQLAEEAWSLRTYAVWIKDLLQQAPNLPDNNVQQCLTVLQPMSTTITRELESLVRESFIVSKQPNVVLKQHNKFTAETRLLVGDKLGFKFLNLKVGVKLISEEHARALKDGGLAVQQATTVAKIGFGPISNNSGDSQDVNLEVERESKRVRACFKSRLLKVDPRKSGGKNNDDQQQVLVCERNYALLFTCSPFQLGDISFPCVWTLSLPVKLTVHGSQERLSQAMILWDHAFAPPEAPFNVPEAVEWHLLSEALKSKFFVQTGATRGLSKSDLDYLAEKCLGNSALVTSGNLSKQLVTLLRFSKDPMRENGEFSFWHWFFDIMALIKQKLLRLWDDGFVKGFIGRAAAEDLLLAQAQPCFLLRFSDSQVGGLSISFAAVDETGKKEIFPLAPFTVKDLDHLSLAQRIGGCPQLQHVDHVVGADGMLYEKSAIFRKEAEMNARQRLPVPMDKDGHPYILSDLVMVARINGRNGTESSPLSPLPQGNCWSPNTEGAKAMLDGVEGTPDWDGTPLDISNIDWRSMGIMTCPSQQPIILSNTEASEGTVTMVYKTSPPPPSSCAGGSDQAVLGAAEAMQDLLNFINGDGPQDPHFRRQIVGEQRRQLMQAVANSEASEDRMDDEESTPAGEHGDVDFGWMPPVQQ